MSINRRTLIQRAKDLLENNWLSKLLFGELPVGSVDNPESEVYLLEHQQRNDGVSYRPSRIPLSSILQPIGNGGKQLLSGGVIWSGSLLNYDVSLLTYTFNGTTILNAGPTQVTLAPSDPTNDRIDAVVVNEAGDITVITGDPAPDPNTPEIPEDQLLVSFIVVGAGTVAPVIGQDIVYDENVEWATSTYGGLPVGSVNFASTTDPYIGYLNIEATGIRSQTGLRFQRVGSINLDDYAVLAFYWWNTVAMPGNKSLLMSVWNGGVSQGNVVNANVVGGLDRTLVGQWQLVIIPAAAFNATNIDRIQFRVNGGGATTFSYRLDYIRWLEGISPPSFDPAISIYEDGNFVATRAKLNFQEGAGVTITATDNLLEERVDVLIEADGDDQFLIVRQAALSDLGVATFDEVTEPIVSTYVQTLDVPLDANDLFTLVIEENLLLLLEDGDPILLENGDFIFL